MLKVGDAAPAFSALASNGETVSLAAWRGRPVVIFFFPAAFTPTCTIETRGFRDNHAELRELGFEVVGISTDAAETQCKFAESIGVQFPMIGDKDRTITAAYGVLWPIIPRARRVTYVLDASHIVRGAFWHEVQASKHLDDVLRLAQRYRTERV